MTQAIPPATNYKGAAYRVVRVAAPLIPYFAVALGLLVLHNAWAAIIGYHTGMVFIILLAKPSIPFVNLFRSRIHRIPLAMVFMGLAGGILIYFTWPFLAIPPDLNSYLQKIGLTSTTWPWFMAYFIFVNPFLEEYYWRGYLGSPSRGLILNDFWFAGYHIIVLAGEMGAGWLVVIFLVLAASAWFWRQADRWGQGLLASAVSHLAADTSVIITIYFLVART